MMRRATYVFCLIAQCATANATSMWAMQATPSMGDTVAAAVDEARAELEAQLRAIEEKTQRITDLTAEFEQEKYTAVLKKPLVSRGTLRIKGSMMRWDTEQPQPSTIAIDESSIQMYYPRQAALEIYPIRKQFAQAAASPVFRAQAMAEHFSIERTDWSGADVNVPDDHLAIKLTPVEPDLREHVEGVKILFDLETGYVAAAEVSYPDADRLMLRFRNIRVHTGLRDDEVALHVPEGTTVTRPFELQAQSQPDLEKSDGPQPSEVNNP